MMEPTARAERERDLYLRLLELGHQEELRPVLEDALALAVGATGAEQGYIELYTDGAPEWAIAKSCSDEDIEEIRKRTSGGVVSQALVEGETIHTPSALLDERFSTNSSVRRQGIESVLCAPLGGKTAVGVLYLQGRSGGGPFSNADIELVETFARHVAPFLTRLLASDRSQRKGDPTAPLREKLDVENIIGRSSAIALVLQKVALVAPLDVVVLITGPSGAGKSHLARAIHDNSPRRTKPFVEMSCTNLVDTLADSQLFGAIPGAYTDAKQRIIGAVEQAEDGTLFLDEIGDLSLATQARLLQLLARRIYTPLGGKEAKANTRLIFATNADLEALVREKRFREDLFFRVNIMPIVMPALGERREDIALLVEHFADLAAASHQLPRLPISNGARLAIASAEWPGNIRQLETYVTRGLIHAAGENAQQIEARHIFPEAKTDRVQLTYQEQMSHSQKEIIERTLEETDWNILEAAQRLDLSRARIYGLIKLHGLRGAE